MNARQILKARAEAERLTGVWEKDHPAPDLSALEKAMREARKPLDNIRNVYCRAHDTGNPCKCESHPEYPAAVEAVKLAALPYYQALAVRAAARQRVQNEYYRTLLRGSEGREAWNRTRL